MSKLPFDLSKLKKVSQDEKTAVFKHKDGHTITVALKPLAANLREQLAKLPCSEESKAPQKMALGGTAYERNLPCLNPSCSSHGAPHPNCTCYAGMAEGGEASAYCSVDRPHKADCQYFAEGTPDEPVSAAPDAEDSASPAAPTPQAGPAPVVVNVNSAPQPQAAPAATSIPIGGNDADTLQGPVTGGGAPIGNPVPPPEASPKPTLADATPPSSAAPAGSAPSPVASLAPPTSLGADTSKVEAPPAPAVTTPQEYHAAIKDAFLSEDHAVDQDLKSGHINPETYNSLFAKKDTIGKIGTLFGLLLSGAGSGLSGQPNAVLDMMNKEIERDLEAQKTSASNRQNFLKIYQQDELNKISAEQAKHGNKLTDAQAYAQKQAALATADLRAHAVMNRTLMHDLRTKAESLPQGSPDQKRYADQLQAVAGTVDLQNADLADKAAGMAMLLNPPSQGPSNLSQNPVDYQKMNQLDRASKLGIPGAPSAGDVSEMTKEATSLEETRMLRNSFNNAFDALDKKFLAGKLSPHDRDSYINSLAGKLAKASAGRYNDAEAKNQINSMIPQTGDWKGTRTDKRKNNDSFFDILEAGTPTLNRFGLKAPATSSGGNSKGTSDSTRASSPAASTQEGQTSKDSDGRPTIFKNGRWVYKK